MEFDSCFVLLFFVILVLNSIKQRRILGNTPAVNRGETKKTERQNRHDDYVMPILRSGLLRLAPINCRCVPADGNEVNDIQDLNLIAV